jgi:beta-galactosidase/beta-glucuronidase
MTWQPVPGNLLTRWAQDLTPETAWRAYPRPQLVRPDWQNLNGLWEYAVTAREQTEYPGAQGQILVPFAFESALSGVKRALRPDERLWYWRTFQVPKAWQGRRLLLHFGAVDWEAEVRLNGTVLGTHRGGYLPFWFDATAARRPGKNELVVAVWDPTDTGWQARGKQVLEPKSIWYTAVSGIWQTVWLEPVPQAFIAGLKITPDVDDSAVRVQIQTGGAAGGIGSVRLRVTDNGRLVADVHASAGEPIRLPIPQAHLWSPASPHLYDLTAEAGADRVTSYFGMRKFGLGKDTRGRTRLCLNDRPLFQFGPLDQGYWPDGLYTPPSEAAMLSDLDAIQRLGCNMLRKHVKVEPSRYYYECDRRGLIVWQDMPSGARAVGDATSFLAILFGSRRRDRDYRYAGRADPASRWEFRGELQELVDHLYNFPCIGMWVPFNEGWGQFDARQSADWLKVYDPTRPVDAASGWFDQGGGDCRSLHVYFKKLPGDRPEKKRALVLSEFGGYSLRLDGHLWNPAAEFGYRKYRSREELTEAYLALLEKELKPWIEGGLSAAVYTQTSDVEIEINGYLSYDRAVEKLDFDRLRAMHLKLVREWQAPAFPAAGEEAEG